MSLTTTNFKRIGSGISSILMLCWLLWPTPDWEIQAEPLVMFIIAFGGWMYLELTTPKESHKNDVRLAHEFLQLFKYQFKQILNEADMLGLLDYEPMSDVYEAYRRWREPDAKYFDKVVQRDFERFMNALKEFRDFYAQNGSPERVGSVTGYSLRGRGEHQGEPISKLSHDRAEKANALATKVWKVACKFEETIRKRIPESYGEKINYVELLDYSHLNRAD